MIDNREDYYDQLIKDKVDDQVQFAQEAKKDSADVEEEPGIDLAEDLAGRCEKILEVEGLAESIRKLENEGYDREETSFLIAEQFAEGEIGNYEKEEKRVEMAIRAAVALLTEAIVAAPVEGIGQVELETTYDYLEIPYNGPIRSAGGTAQALSVFIADYVRQHLGVGEYEARPEEVERYIEEIQLYDESVPLQYKPKRKEIEIIVENTPVMLGGGETADGEIEGYRDLERIDGNFVRGGMCLVLAEGIALKAPKLQKYRDRMDVKGWEWLDKLVDKDKDEEKQETEEKTQETTTNKNRPKENWKDEFPPVEKYAEDITGGRPKFGDASRQGAFRLRYGRSRNIGLAATGINPATMDLLGGYLATGTQLKSERPGKAMGMAGVDSIEGPFIKLRNGDCVQVNDPEEAKKYENKIDEIIDNGELLVPIGEFIENNHTIAPSPYVPEWWKQDAKKENANIENPENKDYETIKQHCKNNNIPLHPQHHPYWTNITRKQFNKLVENHPDYNKYPQELKPILEELLIEHKVDEDNIIITNNNIFKHLKDACTNKLEENEEILDRVKENTGVEVRQKATLRIGARMGRNEKAKPRIMGNTTGPAGLYPIGKSGGRSTDAIKAYEKNKNTNIDGEQEEQNLPTVTVNIRYCTQCNQQTHKPKCPECNNRTKLVKECQVCNKKHELEQTECDCGSEEFNNTQRKQLNITQELEQALKNQNSSIEQINKAKAVEGLSSKHKPPEPLEKLVERAKQDLYVFRDGTIRYDMMDLPITSFKPEEIGITVEKAQELGYTHDTNGKKLENPEQVIEIYPQDIILPKDSMEYLLKAANFIDNLLENFYDHEPYYNADNINDLVGEHLIGLAPHTSAGILGRVIGYTDTRAGYSSPFWHAAKRRNCFHPETSINTKQNGKWENKTIKQFVEKHMSENPQEDDYGTKYTNIENKEIQTESYDPETQTPVLKTITHVNKHIAPDHLVKITTETGKSLRVTPDHPVLTYNPETREHEEKQASEVKPSDNLITQNEQSNTRIEDISNVEYVDYDSEYVYSVTVKEMNKICLNEIYSSNCDGDADSVMLLMDGLLNFSKKFLPEKRGGRMDTPLVLTTELDTTEIDDEAYNVDMMSEYPIEFYEDSMNCPDPGDLDYISIAEEIKEKGMGFDHNFSVSRLGSGPKDSAYVLMEEGMDNKVEQQMLLASRLRSVDANKVAEALLQAHFFPDTSGNLRAFCQQEFQCKSCYEKYKFPPFHGGCLECGSDVSPTMYEGMVTKYQDIMNELKEEYDISSYTEQRLEFLNHRIQTVFGEDDQQSLEDFM